MSARNTFLDEMSPDEILAVDDTPASLTLLSNILGDAGYRVRLASDGELALRSAKARRPALILLDIKMPGIDGFEVCKRLKEDEKTSSIPIIFLSALDAKDDKAKAFSIGGQDYINKPIHAAELIARINTHLALWHAQLDLEERNAELKAARDTLEERVKERSAELEQTNQRLRQQIDAHLQTLEALRKSEFNYRRIVDTANEGVWVLGRDARTAFVNTRMAEILGYSSEEINERPVTDFMFEDDAPDHLKKIESCRQGLPEHYERRFRRKDGQTVWALASATPVFDDEHFFQGSFAMFTDITERKQTEEYVLSLNQELSFRVKALEEANSELQSVSYSLSHDMRPPLRAINGFISILLEEYKHHLDDQGQRYLEIARRSTERMGKLIDGLLEFVRLSRLDISMETVDMAALTRSVFEKLRAASPERNIRFHLGELPPAFCDGVMIRNLMACLLGNAIKFTAPRTEAVIEVGAIAEGERNAYYVKDNGVGFDMRYAENLFGLCSLLHSLDEFEGVGVGLAIVKRIVDRHRGRVWAEGVVDQGATFHFTLLREEARKRPRKYLRARKSYPSEPPAKTK
jgi:PAS domain S-box-containing protein